MSRTHPQPPVRPGVPPATSPLGRLLWPERVPVTEPERQLAGERISRARAAGALTEEEADSRLAQVPAVRTRADLRAVLRDLPAAVAPAGLPTVTRVVAALWLGTSLVHFIIWALVVLISRDWDDPWWLWPVLAGGAITAGLGWITESNHRAYFPAGPAGDRSHA